MKRINNNKRVVVFRRDYRLRDDMVVSIGDEFSIGNGNGDLQLDPEGRLLMFVGEFAPHRVSPEFFEIYDEIETTVVQRRRVDRGGIW